MISKTTIIIAVLILIPILSWLNKMSFRMKMRRLIEMQTIMQMRMLYPQAERDMGYPRGDKRPRKSSMGSSLVLLLIMGGTIFGLAQVKERFMTPVTPDDPTSLDVATGNVNTDSIQNTADESAREQDEIGYTPLDAPRKRGTYQGEDYQAAHHPPASGTNQAETSTDEVIVLTGFGQQIIALHSYENVKYNLNEARKSYPDAQILIIEDTDDSGSPIYKGVIGQFENEDTARKAFPALDKRYPGRFLIQLDKLRH